MQYSSPKKLKVNAFTQLVVTSYSLHTEIPSSSSQTKRGREETAGEADEEVEIGDDIYTHTYTAKPVSIPVKLRV
jgi:hypothetical protein